MKFRRHVLLVFLIGCVFSCAKKKVIDDVNFDGNFAGARLDSVEVLGNNKYVAHILPAFEPVNKSPYFAFSVSSKTNKNIEVKLNYDNYKHRYIPKLSVDRKSWTNIEEKDIKVDTTTGIATLQLKVSPQKLYVAAQEIETSKDTYLWVDNILKSHPEVKKIVAGKTALNNNNYCLEIENENIKSAIGLIARQHPPETPGGTVGFKAFYETLLSGTETAKTFREHFNIYAFPLFNPDGADMGNWRHNAKGADLNRDWKDFTQPETQMAKKYFANKAKEGNKIRFAIDFHTSYSGPYLLVLDSINEVKTQKIIPDWIKNIETNSSFKVEARRRSQDLPYCYNYFYNEFGSESVTYEDGDEIDRDIIRDRAKVYANQLMKTLINKIEANAFKN